MSYNSDLANYFLYAPFDRRASVNEVVSQELTEHEFFKSTSPCYVEPAFLSKISIPQEDALSCIRDYQTSHQDLLILRRDQKNDYNNLTEWLWNFNDTHPSVYTILGQPGSGKTTFIHSLKMHYESKNENYKWIIIDLMARKNPILWLGQYSKYKTDVGVASDPWQKLHGCILNEIRNLLFGYYVNTTQPDISHICLIFEDIIRRYNSSFASSYPPGATFIEELEKLDITGKKEQEKAEMYAKCCQDFFSVLGDGRERIFEALDVLFLLFRCRDLSETEKKYVVVFDNLERFIEEDEIFSKDIFLLRNDLRDYVAKINDIHSVFCGYFKIMMVVRKSTYYMFANVHATEASPREVDLSSWYDLNEIFKKKSKWYKAHNIQIKNEALFDQITNDIAEYKDGTIKGLKLEIDSLFNHNKRLITVFFGEVLDSKQYEEAFAKFQELRGKNSNTVARFAARSIVRGILLEHLGQTDRLFKHLHAYPDFLPYVQKDSMQTGVGDARKILTIIYNKFIAKEERVSVTEVLKAFYRDDNISRVWKTADYADERSRLAEVIFYMSSYNRKQNDCVQFVELHFSEVSSNAVIRTPTDMEDLITNYPDECILSIQPGGIAYLQYIVASFEFFSLRYASKGGYSPLFLLIPTKDDIGKLTDIKSSKLIRRINVTVQYALKCIEKMSAETPLYLKLTCDTTEMTHTERIIQQHTDYLKLLIDFIDKQYCKNNNLTADIVEKYGSLIKEINREINRYPRN